MAARPSASSPPGGRWPTLCVPWTGHTVDRCHCPDFSPLRWDDRAPRQLWRPYESGIPSLEAICGLVSLQTRGHPGGGARCHYAKPTLGLSGQWKTTHLTETGHKAVSWPLSLLTGEGWIPWTP